MRGRMLIIVGVVVLLGAMLVGGVLWMRGQQPGPADVSETPVGEAEIYIPPENVRDVIVARQNILRGQRVLSETVEVLQWPDDAVPAGALSSVASAVGLTARVDIVQGMPLMEGMLTGVGDLGAVGSKVALQIPPGKVAYALPVARYSSVAWSIQPGDHVDVIASLLLLDLDEEFQTALPNNASCVQPPEGEGCERGVMGRIQVLPNGWVVNLTPGEQQSQYPRLVTQLTVQDAIVLRVGDWPLEEQVPSPATGVSEETGEGVLDMAEPVAPQVEGEEVLPPQRAPIEPLTVIVTPQDAMVLKYMEELGADMDLVLRSAGEERERFNTSSITLQYIFERFNIELPAKLPYGTTPPVEFLPGNLGGLSQQELEAVISGETYVSSEE